MNISRLAGLSLLSMLGVSSAYADAPAAASAASGSPQGGLMSFLPMLLILVFFMYFMVIRPQSKRAKEHKNLLGNLKVGDEVVTIGGIFGKIEKINEDCMVLNIAEKVDVTIQKSSVAHSLPKGTIKSSSK